MNVSVNFIISNAWMKQIGAVINYGAAQIRVPLLNDITKFPIVFRPPTKSVPSYLISATLANQSNQKAAFVSFPNIYGLVSVMTVLNPKIPVSFQIRTRHRCHDLNSTY